MENVTKIALSRAMALQRQMDMVANNVANLNTTGFKGEQPVFTEFLIEPRKDESYSMVQDKASVRNLAQGAMQQTGGTFDVALLGDGYFALDTLQGVRYTRAGNFTLNNDRTLVNVAGLPVLDDSGNTIQFPAGARDITITSDGTIFANQAQVGKLRVVTFTEPQKLQPIGNSLYQTDELAKADTTTTVQQGYLENSNVQGVTEMNRMIEVARQYESVQNIMKSEHDRLRNAYSKLSKIS